jgi:hypothetical protein
VEILTVPVKSLARKQLDEKTVLAASNLSAENMHRNGLPRK